MADTEERRIAPRGPFAWSASLGMLSTWQPVRHFARGDGTAAVAFSLDGTFEPVAALVRDRGEEVVLELAPTSDPVAASAQVGRMFSLDVDATDYPLVGERDPAIGRVMRAFPGLRPVLFPSPYEAAVWAVISQRVAQPQAAHAKAALSAEHGEQLTVGGREVRLVPSPERMLRVRGGRGLAAEKIERLHAVARAALEGRLDAGRLRAMGHTAAIKELQTIRGIGPFWSGGIYLRACGVTEPFPADEPKTLRALADAHGLQEVPTDGALRAIVERFKPFGMWVSVLLRVASNRGAMGPREG
jgi:DNA-3-methyladenine glycosylase II